LGLLGHQVQTLATKVDIQYI